MIGFWLRLLLMVAVSSVVIYVAGKITREILREKAQENGIKEGLIKEIDNCKNKIKLKDLENYKEIEIQGEDIDSDLVEGDIIYA